MNTEKKYNGWANYETWLVKLWMDNEAGSYNYWEEIAQETWSDASPDLCSTRGEVARRGLATRLKDEHEENAPEVTGLYADLVNAALSEVDWYEIADSLLDEVEKEEEKTTQ